MPQVASPNSSGVVDRVELSVANLFALPPRPKGRRKLFKHESMFETRHLLHRMTGEDLTAVNGIGSLHRSAQHRRIQSQLELHLVDETAERRLLCSAVSACGPLAKQSRIHRSSHVHHGDAQKSSALCDAACGGLSCLTPGSPE